MSHPLIKLENAGLSVQNRWLVRGVSFLVNPGEIVTLIGPNGSGKSTTAKMALGISSPSEGKALRAPDLQVGYVPQRLNIDWTLPLTVRRFMCLTQKLSSMEIVTPLERTGVAHLLDHDIHSLSGGELQRVLLSRAIALKPDLLVLDEPVQGVDINGEIEMYNLILAIRNELNCGVLMISHDLHLVMAATDQVVCLNGHMCCNGTPVAVAETDEYKHLFGNRVAAGLAVYQHSHDHEHLPDGSVRHADGSVTDHCHPDDGHHHGQEKSDA